MTIPLTEEDLHELYLWVDDIPISRPKRNITRDFSDGCCVAEVVKFFFPRLVDLHNYTPSMSMKQKRDNWDTLNNRVFRKLHFEVPPEEINDITAGVPGAIERFLRALRTKIAQIKARREKMGTLETCPGGSDDDDKEGSEARGRGGDWMMAEKKRAVYPRCRPGSGVGAGPAVYRPSPDVRKVPETRRDVHGNHDRNYDTNDDDAVTSFRLLLDEKDRTIFELRETVSLLSEKVTKLEELVRVKDGKLNEYRAKLSHV
ncbi:sperm flagellar protein 1 [Trypanosoma rangeli]|uniref:Sperm flagellar protein 1 n=1 Tax=Trypanosoma rangeli TaxID=5698 RepID=A0A422NGQ0_TRYRA|nr:sperm flagellar protein 1 [Trypanosoma rangeli]RNF04642.1 sperm flagellar protein 1 [Trypanosoma rangeli]|eukprot:RNF04642.1 sperm flagellar protein 1 [Trypanosoma rangeli]